MMTSRLKFLMFAVFLGLGAFSGESFSQEPPLDARASEIQRVRSLFLHSENPRAAETVLKDAFGEAIRDFLGQINEATEEAILAFEASFKRELVSSAIRERVYFEIASRLKDLGTPACLPLLGKFAERKPLVVAHLPGCRRSIPVPAFDYPLQAKRAEFAVLERSFLKDFQELDAAGQLDRLFDSAEAKHESPRLSASLKLVPELPRELRTQLSERLLLQDDMLTVSAGELLIQVYLTDSIVPEPEEFRRLPIPPAQRFLEAAVKSSSSTYRHAVLDVARSHSGVASLATYLDASRGRLDPRDYLERDGASAAAVLSRNKSLELTRQLAVILSDSKASESLRRQAALALMHQETPESRVAVARSLASSELPLALARKLQSWLEQ